MLVREFRLHDLKRVFEIEKMSFSEPYDVNILKQLHNIGAGFLVVQENSYVIGYIIFWVKELDKGHIISIAVDKNYQKINAGSKLLDTCINIFKSFDIFKIALEVRANNHIAISFYQKFGFKVSEFLPKYYENGDDGLAMILEL
ncbi:ribosomal protein S18-alanine N-acetyltransferase [Methanobrevibacter filiformis]|uniref:Ribosomal-protein-alanine N-acetyltransferase n=1 Tax=Methanobrevibacter filiformis TaxID=55758 RepID=A0A166EZN8_9EURY|nr:ribosomal protein S18-alanine N-acetyltransferase [Methanobrevibacter filiformis]KZX17173.1 ribosomal-protein-alanine N-acetyltransferase [Methanobrevibacter filiformis]